MFLSCNNLVGGKGTTWNSSHIDKTYARVDGGTNSPGYLTYRGRKAYAQYDGYTLKLCYDTNYLTDDYVFLLEDVEGSFMDALDQAYGVTYFSVVEFDPSFADYRPKSTSFWFSYGNIGWIDEHGMHHSQTPPMLQEIIGIENLNTSEVTDMYGMFLGCGGLKSIDLSGFDTRNVESMGEMFGECIGLESIDLSSFDTRNVTDMAAMFYGCQYLESLNLSGFDTRNVEDMRNMFSNCSTLTSLDLSGFDTRNVTKMSGMFSYCDQLTGLDLIGFDTGNVTEMYAMFSSCENLVSVDLSNFDTGKVTNMAHMFDYCDKLTTIYVGDGWNTDLVTNSYYMFYFCNKLKGGAGTTYSSQHTDKEYARVDGGTASPGYLTYRKYEPYTVLLDGTLTFWYDYNKATWQETEGAQVFDITDGNWPGWYSYGNNVTTAVFDKSFATVKPVTTSYWFGGMRFLESIVDMKYLNTSEVTDMNHMFYYCFELQSLDLSHFDTSKVTDMQLMFTDCNSLTELDVSSFDTHNVETMNYMFNGCYGLKSLDLSNFNTEKVILMDHMFTSCMALENLDVSSFNTSLVTSMNNMFSNCEALKSLDVSNFDTGNVTDMGLMFNECSSLKSLDLSGFNTSNVEIIYTMFYGCSSLKSLDVSNFDVSKVTSLSNLFDGCSSLRTLDLTNFNTAKVTEFGYLFRNCSNLRTIYVGPGWNTQRVNYYQSNDIFKGCINLRGGMGTVYDPSMDGIWYAHIDGGPDNPGYFTDKSLIPTGIDDAPLVNENLEVTNDNDEWFSLDGRKLSGRPTVKGLYIKGGKKVVVK